MPVPILGFGDRMQVETSALVATGIVITLGYIISTAIVSRFTTLLVVSMVSMVSTRLTLAASMVGAATAESDVAASSTEESFGFSEGFLCFYKRFILKQLVLIRTLASRLKNGRKASVFELSSPQYRRRCELRVIFAG
jgi:hypothetical protein